MQILEKVKKYLDKLRELPDDKKKIILWVSVAIVALIMMPFIVYKIKNGFSQMGESVKNIEFPKIETPNFPEIDLDKLKDELKNELEKNPDLIK